MSHTHTHRCLLNDNGGILVPTRTSVLLIKSLGKVQCRGDTDNIDLLLPALDPRGRPCRPHHPHKALSLWRMQCRIIRIHHPPICPQRIDHMCSPPVVTHFGHDALPRRLSPLSEDVDCVLWAEDVEAVVSGDDGGCAGYVADRECGVALEHVVRDEVVRLTLALAPRHKAHSDGKDSRQAVARAN